MRPFLILRLHYVPVAYRGILVIYFSVFSRSITSCYVFLPWITIPVTNRGSNKPVCHGGTKERYDYPQSITIISTFCYGLLRSDAVSCVLIKA